MNRIIIVFLLTTLYANCQESTQVKWILSSDKSYISYEGKHILHQWSGTSKKVKGVMIMENNQPLKTAIISAVKDFDSGNSSRDSHAMEILEALLFPDVSFFGDTFIIKDERFDVSGKMKFHSIEKDISVSGEWYKTDENIILKGSFELKPSDFEIDLPDFMLVKMENNLNIEYELIFLKG
ncbi:YceI family protein [Flavobacteriaceae bacterium]|nr:YceI family protein [Flavobacteriaceae bacterium]